MSLDPNNGYAYYVMGRWKQDLKFYLREFSKRKNIPRYWGCDDLKQGAILGNENSKKWYEESFCN